MTVRFWILGVVFMVFGTTACLGGGSAGGSGGSGATADAALVADNAAADTAAAETVAVDTAAKDSSADSAPADSAPADAAKPDVVAVDTGPAGPDPAIVAIQAQIDELKLNKADPMWRTKVPVPTQATFTAGKTYLWVLDTDKGQLKLALRPDVAPMHVTSTIYLTLLGYYDTLNFHRIIKNFMAQGGDPLGNGKGGPGYKYKLEVSTAAKHDARGVLSMANAGLNTEGSQFFITFSPQPKLDGGYSVFGKLVQGDETLTAMEAGGTVGEGTPVKVIISAATVVVE